MHNIKKWMIGIGIICICLFGGCSEKDTLLSTERPAETTGQAKTEDDAGAISSQSEEETESEQTTEALQVAVYVCGAVNHAGVYYVSPDAIKETAVQMAGGFTEEADPMYVNLAQPVTSGERIYIPTKEETAGMSWETGELPVQNQDGAAQADSGKVNINTATKEELMTLPGIGESKADAIIAYREARGNFHNAEELMNIDGIKEGVYNKIKDLIIVG